MNKNKKTSIKIFDILLYCLGFPTLTIICLVKSLEWNSYGMYGKGSFAPVAIVAFLWLVCGLITLGIKRRAKRHNKPLKNTALKCTAVPVIAICGLFLILDFALPPILKKATSGTIYYEHVVEDAEGQHELLCKYVDEFKKKNGLGPEVKYSDKAFQDKFRPLFKSMDKAYNAFDPLAIEMALDNPDLAGAIKDGSFPISVAATLMLKTVDTGNGNDHNLTIPALLSKNIDIIKDVIPEVLESGLDFSDEEYLDEDGKPIVNVLTGAHATKKEVALNSILQKVLVTKKCDGIEWNIFNILGENMLAPSIDPNYNLKTVDGKEAGSAVGYQYMAWMDGIPKMFFIPLLSIRSLAYFYSAVIAIITFIHFLLLKAMRGKDGEIVVENIPTGNIKKDKKKKNKNLNKDEKAEIAKQKKLQKEKLKQEKALAKTQKNNNPKDNKSKAEKVKQAQLAKAEKAKQAQLAKQNRAEKVKQAQIDKQNKTEKAKQAQLAKAEKAKQAQIAKAEKNKNAQLAKAEKAKKAQLAKAEKAKQAQLVKQQKEKEKREKAVAKAEANALKRKK